MTGRGSCHSPRRVGHRQRETRTRPGAGCTQPPQRLSDGAVGPNAGLPARSTHQGEAGSTHPHLLRYIPERWEPGDCSRRAKTNGNTDQKSQGDKRGQRRRGPPITGTPRGGEARGAQSRGNKLGRPFPERFLGHQFYFPGNRGERNPSRLRDWIFISPATGVPGHHLAGPGEPTQLCNLSPGFEPVA